MTRRVKTNEIEFATRSRRETMSETKRRLLEEQEIASQSRFYVPSSTYADPFYEDFGEGETEFVPVSREPITYDRDAKLPF